MTARNAALLSLALAAGCSGPELGPVPEATAPLSVSLGLSNLQPAVGDTIALTVEAIPSGESDLIGLQALIRFDPAALRFIGQPLTGEALVLVNQRATTSGEVRFVALDMGGLADVPADFRFVVARAGTPALNVALEEAVFRNGMTTASASITSRPVERSSPFAAAAARPISAEDWIVYFGDAPYLASSPALRVPGQGRIYGDANLSQTLTVGDVVSVSNVAVGNLLLLTDVNRDYAIAANVAPANLPGLGEPDDPAPPGRNANGTYTITVGDATAIGNEAVGNLQEVPGALIPGRGPVPTNRVIVDSVPLNRTFYRDTIYVLRGTVIVGSSTVSDVTLTIQAGTRIEGDELTRGRLVIRRGGNLMAQGTRLQPVVFTCSSPNPVPGCWGGLTINGFGVLNNGDPQPPDSIGFPTKHGAGGSGVYGGILVQDNSGTIQYTRIEYAGAVPFTAPDTLPALQLLAVGSGTTIENLQVFQPLGDAIYLSGGTAQLRNLLVTNPGGRGLVWRDGWQGKGQFIALQMGLVSRGAVLGESYAAGPDLIPRSEPVLSHLTVTGPAPTGTPGAALRFDHGSAGIILNSLFYRAASVGLEIQGASSCAQMADSLSIRGSVFFANGADFSADADCADESAFALDPSRGNRVIDPLLIAPFQTTSPDLRPSFSSPLLSGWVIPTADGFMDQTATWIGAVEPANIFGANVPWYVGWTRGY